MAYKCDYCQKGVSYGHAVSHAKNRLRRIFKPNLQKLKVLKNGIVVQVKFCTGCIKRLKKDGTMGVFTLRKFVPKVVSPKATPPPVAKKVTPKAKKETKVSPKKEKAPKELNIEAIVGKKS